MPHAFLVLLLLATLFRTLSVATGEVGNIWDPDGKSRPQEETDVGGTWDPDGGQSETDIGSSWDPNG